MFSSPARVGFLATVIALASVSQAACQSEREAPPGPRPTTSVSTSPSSAQPSRDPASSTPPFDPSSIRLELHPVMTELSMPVALTHAGDSSGRLYVAEQAGRIVWFRPGETNTHEFLDLSEKTVAGGEQGLLGLAFHPDFETNGRLFVNYTDLAGDTVIEEYTSGSLSADPGSGRVILTFDQPYPNHNGGHLAFGLDGFLYIASGDGGSGGDPHDNGQRLDTLLGKILRIDVDVNTDSHRAYAIPPANPFVDDSSARPEIWAYGLRNPWRFSFDQVAQDLWIGDVGQNVSEEINRAPAGASGINYGWNELEGSECYEPPSGCNEKGTQLPLTQYSHEFGCSVTGGYVYRGSEYPAMQGGYFFSDFCSGTLWAIPADAASGRSPSPMLETDYSVSSFGQDEEGELYITDMAAGQVLQLIDKSR